MRVLKWMIDRAHGRVGAQETPIGNVPVKGDLDLTGLKSTPEELAAATRIDLSEWEQELDSQTEWFDKLGKTLPRAIALQREQLVEAVKTARRVQAKS